MDVVESSMKNMVRREERRGREGGIPAYRKEQRYDGFYRVNL